MNGTPLSVIILAAGQSTRIKSKRPKVLHAVGGEPMVWRVIRTASTLNPSQIITVIRDDMQDVAKALKGKSDIAIQNPQLGTAHAVSTALPLLKSNKGHVLILYADTPLIHPSTLSQMREKLQRNTAIVVLGFEAEDPSPYGRLITNGQDKRVERIVEQRDASPQERQISLCNSGVFAVNAQHLAAFLKSVDNKNAKKEYYLTDIVAIAQSHGFSCEYTKCHEEEVIGINTRMELARAENIVQQRNRLAAMENGVTLMDPESTYIATNTRISTDVVIHPHVVIGPGTTIEEDVEIRSFSHIEGAYIRKGAIVGPFARLRPGSDIGEEARVGNFVEIKKSVLAKGVKASHLSYIGDAEIDEGTNIGAGTITCNYDGVNKHKTIIGKDVFVGSNTAFVAPVTVGNGAIIGAGSTITQDVEPHSLAIARNRQINKENMAHTLLNKKKKKKKEDNL